MMLTLQVDELISKNTMSLCDFMLSALASIEFKVHLEVLKCNTAEDLAGIQPAKRTV